MTRRALISVSDKTGLAEFAQGLAALGFEILSTGGTSKFLKNAGLNVIDVSDYTGFPEIMDGRVKTLHPKVHGAILGRPDLASDAEAIKAHGIIPFELVVVNLYPFAQTVSKPGVTLEDAIENIDIGGPSMVRSAAKNHHYIGIVTQPSQYDDVLSALKAGKLPESLRKKLMLAAFEMTAAYDAGIVNYFKSINYDESKSDAPANDYPETLQITVKKQQGLRYGENPHQSAAFYVEPNPPAGSLATAKILHGKELSYNNLLDLDAALLLVREFADPAVAILKHNNPCGCAINQQLSTAFDAAYEGDPVSAFGSIIGINRSVDLATAERMCEPGRFIEAIIAPAFDEDAFQLLTTKPKWRNNVRLLSCADMNRPIAPALEYRRVSGGLLVQDRDLLPDPEDQWQCVTERQPTEQELTDLRFAWLVCKHVKSNAIVFAKNGAITGVGAGQMSRLDSSWIAATKSGERCQGGVVASDAFFPFRDGIDQAAKAGIKAAIQPGGSKNDPQVIDACNEHGIAMLTTSRRHFKH